MIGWPKVPLGEVASLDAQRHDGSPRPFVGLEHIESGTGRLLRDVGQVDAESGTFAFGPDHVLYGRLRPYLNKVHLPDFHGHCSTEIYPILPNARLDRRYLFFWLASQSTIDLIMATCTGARMPRANLREVLNLTLPLPPIAEQQRIVAILDEAFEGTDAASAKNERSARNAGDLFVAARKALFSDQDPSWTAQPIASICENLDGRRRPVTKRDRVAGGVPYYGASGVVDYVQAHLFDEDLLLVSEDGANLLARTYPIAFSISGPSWVNNHAHVLRFTDKRTQKFVEHYLNSLDLEPYVTGMAQPKLSQGALNKILVPLPPVDRQAEIVASLEQLQSETKELLALRQRKLALLAELKQSLLARAFSGELTREPLAA